MLIILKIFVNFFLWNIIAEKKMNWEIKTDFAPVIHGFFLKFIFIYFWPCWAACGILVPSPSIELVPSAMEEPILSHWTTREVPNHSLIKRHLCCFKYFPIANITTNTINIDLLYLHKYICRLKFPKVELLGQKICIFIILIATARLTSMEITHFTFPWEIWEGFPWGTGGREPACQCRRCKM